MGRSVVTLNLVTARMTSLGKNWPCRRGGCVTAAPGNDGVAQRNFSSIDMGAESIC
jgi:hypothetical protein